MAAYTHGRWNQYCGENMMRKRNALHFFIALVLYVCNFALYANTQDLAQLEKEVVSFIKQQHPPEANISIEIQQLDQRLKLQICDQNLGIAWAPGSRDIGRTTVSVSCTSPKPWRVFVRATVEKEHLSWVLTRAVRKGEILSKELVVQQSIMLGDSMPGGMSTGLPIVDVESWLGQIFVRPLQAGRVLLQQSLEMPNLVSKGDAVSIVYRSSRLAIRAKGIALESGSLSEKIAVKNSVSNKTIEASVVGRSRVSVLDQ
jgi:flagella basal body P-ring formation protein FlgA